MTRLLAAALIALLVAGCAQAVSQAKTAPDDPTTAGHTESGGAGGGSM